MGAFDNLFANREGGPNSVFGNIGQALGVPSMQEKQSTAEGGAFAELSKLRDSGLPPEKAITQFMQSPQGQQWFASGASDVSGTLQKFLQTTVPAPNKVDTTAPGYMRTETNPVTGQPVSQTTVPPTDTQNFQNFVDIGKLNEPGNKELLSELAYYHSLPPAMQPGKLVERAIDGLVKSGGVSPDWGQKLKGGLIKVQELTNPAGDKTGEVALIDMTNPQSPVVRKLNIGVSLPGGAAQPQGQPGVSPTDQQRQSAIGAPADVQGVPTTSETVKKAINPASGKVDVSKLPDRDAMFIGGTGPNAIAVNAVGRFLEFIDPALPDKVGIGPTARQTAARRTEQQQLQNSLVNLTKVQSTLNVPIKVINSVTQMQEGLKTLDSPAVAMQDSIKLHQLMTDEIARETTNFNDRTLPNSEKTSIANRVNAYKDILQRLPDPAVQADLLKFYNAGNTNAPGIVQTGKNMIGALTEGGKKTIEANTAPNAAAISKMTGSQVLSIDRTRLDAAGQAALKARVDQLISEQNQPLPAQRFSDEMPNQGPSVGQFTASPTGTVVPQSMANPNNFTQPGELPTHVKPYGATPNQRVGGAFATLRATMQHEDGSTREFTVRHKKASPFNRGR